MSRFRGYRNRYSKKNRIYSMEELLKMSMGDFFDNEEEIDSQDSLIGLPTNEELKNSPNVRFVDSYTDESGQSYPARWESLLPTQAETIANMGNLKNQTNKYDSNAGMMDNSFSEIDELTQESIEKLNQSKQENVQNPKFEDLRKEINIPKDDIQDFESAEKPMNTNNDMMSQLLNGLSTVLSMFNQGDMANNTDINSNELDTKMTTIDSTQPDVRSYFIDPNQSSQKIYAKENKEQDNEKLKEQNDVKQQEQLQLNKNLADYINELVGENIDYGFIGNEPTTSSQPDIPIYPENGVIKGGISKIYLPEKDKEILAKSEGYISPTKASRDYNKTDETAIQFNDKENKDRPDAKQMLEIGIYGVDSYNNNDQFKHIKDGSADLYNEKYKLTGNKLIPSDMKGIEFSKESDFSKRISENGDFQQTVKNAIEKNGGKLPDKIELDFSKDSNLNYSIGHATLLNPKITDDGYIEGVVYDKYDYDYKYLNTPETTLYNAGAATLHEWDKLEYYYYFIPVRFKY